MSLVAVIGLIYSLNMSSLDFYSFTIVLIVPGLFFLYTGVKYSNDSEEGISYGGFCESCGEWCETIFFKGQECCDCADELPLNDRCPTCSEKSQENMS
jgi:hypothetical protein